MTTPICLPSEGTKLMMAISSTQTEIGLVTEFDGPEVQVAPIETTHLTSTLHTRRPSKLPDPQKVTFKIQFDPNDTSMHKLIADRVNTPGTIDAFKVVFVDGNTTPSNATFSGFFTKFKGPAGAKVEENNTAEVEIQMTTIITYTVGTP